MNDMKCLRCGAEMIYYTKERLQLGKTGWVLGDLPNLLAGALEVDIYTCPACHKLEFYVASEATEAEVDEEMPTVTCPACGTVHDFDYPKCPKCRYEY